MIFKSDGKQSDLNGFLDNGSHVQGELHFETSFRVDGKFTGKVSSEGDLIVGDGGEIDGDVSVGQVFVSGTVKGTIQASRKVQISPRGKVFADIETPSLVIEDGAYFEGRCAMVREGAKAAVPKLVAPQPPKVSAARDR
jgi:cytoskeletal protein CcmA (bactofilin family)